MFILTRSHQKRMAKSITSFALFTSSRLRKLVKSLVSENILSILRRLRGLFLK
jgi:hypothetical protein